MNDLALSTNSIISLVTMVLKSALFLQCYILQFPPIFATTLWMILSFPVTCHSLVIFVLVAVVLVVTASTNRVGFNCFSFLLFLNMVYE